jgi:hypothetical protein
MKFHIQSDDGGAITGWIVPDNPLATGRVAVHIGGRRAAEIETTHIMPAIKEWGWHSTGICGFSIEEAAVPGLAESPRLDLYDADTNVLIYRRPFADHLAAKIAILNPSIEPPTTLQNALFRHFQMSYFDMEKLSDELDHFIIDYQFCHSIMISGGFPYIKYEAHLTAKEFTTSILVGDAFVELARRLLWLRGRAALAASPQQAWRTHRFRGPMAFAEALPIDNVAGLRKAFRGVDQEVWNFLSSPLTRVLACRVPDERIDSYYPSQALEALSRLHVVGHEAFWEPYVSTVFARLGLTDQPHPPAPAIPPEVQALAEALRRAGTPRAVIEYDAALSEAVQGVVAKQWAGG